MTSRLLTFRRTVQQRIGSGTMWDDRVPLLHCLPEIGKGNPGVSLSEERARESDGRCRGRDGSSLDVVAIEARSVDSLRGRFQPLREGRNEKVGKERTLSPLPPPLGSDRVPIIEYHRINSLEL